VVFGASGNLARRKVLPALYDLAHDDLLPERYAVVGYALDGWDDDAFRAAVRSAVETHARNRVDEQVWVSFARRLVYVAGSLDDDERFAALLARLADLDATCGTDGRRVYYLAIPPAAFLTVVARLSTDGRRGRARIVIEKPFGRDLSSARALNAAALEVFAEDQLFRIDHYLGKETVQNIFVLRFANALFERIWNRDVVANVQVTVAEPEGIDGRGAYYEQAGALRDVLQNHVLQMLAFVAMEPPRALDPEAIRDEKVKVLRAMRPLDATAVVRGQYTAGVIDGTRVPGYREERDVAAGSSTETFVAARAWIDNWRWEGVPFLLRVGKRLPRRATEVAVILRDPPTYLFEDIGVRPPEGDHVVLRIQPEEGGALMVHAKAPGPGITLQRVDMDFSYGRSFVSPSAQAYERLLLDVMHGDHTLFPRYDEVLRAWEIVEPTLDGTGDLNPYPAGTWGPPAADRLAPRGWHLH